MTSPINLEGKTLSSTIAKLNAPLTQAFNPQLSNESPIAITPTPTSNTQAQRLADFETLTAALEYAAAGNAGYNFYDAKGNLRSVLSYQALRQNARILAQRLAGLGLVHGDRSAWARRNCEGTDYSRRFESSASD